MGMERDVPLKRTVSGIPQYRPTHAKTRSISVDTTYEGVQAGQRWGTYASVKPAIPTLTPRDEPETLNSEPRHCA